MDMSIIYFFNLQQHIEISVSIVLSIIADAMLFLLLTCVFSKNSKRYNESFKQRIIKSLVDNFYDKVKYTSNKGMLRKTYDEANYNESYNRYYSDDYFEGYINNVYKIEMAEVKTIEEKTSRDSNGNTSTTRTTKFHGLFAKIELGKSINTDVAIQSYNKMFMKNKVQMDSQDFEKEFDVTSGNQITAMQILTSDIMEKLLSFKKSAKIPFDIIILRDVMYIRFHTSENLFEMKSFKKGALDKKLLEKYYKILDFSYTVSEKMAKTIEEVEI